MLLDYFKRVRLSPFSVVVAATVGLFVETVIYDMCISVIPALLEAVLHVSGDHNGQLSGVTAISKTATSLSIGYLSDRLGKRKLPLLITGAGYFIMAFFFYRSGAYWHLIVARIAQGVTSGATWTIVPGMVADVYSGEIMGSRLAIAYTGSQMAHIVGPVVGGFVFDHYGNKGIGMFITTLALFDLFFRVVILPESLELKRSMYSKIETSGINGDVPGNSDVLVGMGPPGDLPNISSLEAHARETTNTEANSIPLNVLRHSISPGSRPGTRGGHNDDDDDDEHSFDIERDIPTEPEATATTSFTEDPSIQLSAWEIFRIWPIQAYNFGSVSVVLISSLIETALPLELSKRYGLSAGGIGATFIALGVPSMLFAAPIGWFISQPKVQATLYPFNRWGIISMSILLNIGCIFYLGLTNSTFEVMFDLALVSILHPLITVPVMTGLAEYLDSMNCSSFAQCYALNQVSQSLAMIVFPPLVASLYHSHTFASTSAIIASLLFILAVLVSIKPISLVIKFGRNNIPKAAVHQSG